VASHTVTIRENYRWLWLFGCTNLELSNRSITIDFCQTSKKMASNTFLIFCIPLTLSCITYFWNPIGFPPIYIHYFERLNCESTQDGAKYAMLLIHRVTIYYKRTVKFKINN
jgi:hypothetical protein